MAEDQGRRAFLRLAAAAGGAGLLASCSPDSQTSATGAGASRTASAAGTTPGGAASAVGAAAPTATSSPSPADWTALRRRLSTHHLVRPDQRGYNSAKELFDPRFDSLRPAGIAYCATPADVSTCLSFARTFKVAVRARSGGHSYAGWSSVTGGLIVDVSQLSSFAVSGTSVRVGAGTRPDRLLPAAGRQRAWPYQAAPARRSASPGSRSAAASACLPASTA